MTNISQHLAHLSPQEKRALLEQLLREKVSQVISFSPLSYGQQALWFIYQSAPESAAYHVAFTARIRSKVDVPALRRAFQELINRHPALRTTFSTRDSEPVQEIHGYQEVGFEEIDASTWTWEELNQRVVEAYRRPFDLQRGPVLRVSLFTRGVEDHLLLLTIHHIACDGWSLWLLLDELRLLYPAEAAGRKASLPPLKLSYADYVRWQAELLASSEGERLWAYWQNQLAGELPALNLPIDRHRPPVQTYQGASYPFKLPEELTQRLKGLARAEGATLYMTLLAAFFVLLHRLTGQEDILVGAPTTGRTQPEFDGIVGYFVNPVVLRASLSGNPTFLAFLSQVRQTVLDALSNQDYPFRLLVERTQPNRDPSRSPIFQVLFVFQRPQQFFEGVNLFAPGETETRVDWGGLLLEPFFIAQQESQFDLTLEMMEASGSLLGRFTYNTDLFDAATIARMAGHFQTLLAGIVANPEARVATLPLLTEGERHQLLVEWNDTKADYPRDLCLHELFEAQVERTPDAVAVAFSDQQVTYRQLNAKANQLAHHIKALGVGPEVLVGICVERSIKMIVGLLGILKAGGAYVPLDPAYPKERLAFMLADAQVNVLLTQKPLVTRLPEQETHVVCLDTDWEDIAQESEENPVSGATADNLAYVIYTSGSTGTPKGVAIEHHSAVNLLHWVRATFATEAIAGVLAATSFCWDLSIFELFVPLSWGGKVVVAETLLHLPDLPEVTEVTLLNTVPSVMTELLRVDGLPASVRTVNLAGEPLQQPLVWQLYRHPSVQEVFNLYGPSEATTYSTWSLVKKDASGAPPIGCPIANTQIYLLDPHLQPVPIGFAGELHIGGAGLARGYLNRPGLTAEKFIKNPFSDEPGARIYKTGDFARYLPDGNIEFLGRIDHQVKIRGFRIELGEIEAVLAQHPSVREVVVIAREDSPGDKRLVAYVVKDPEQAPTPSELRRFLQEKLPDYMVPAAFVILEEMPLTPNGKVDRRALPAPEGHRPPLESADVMPQTEAERRIAAVWGEALQVEKVGIHDNFFELGGHSLLMVQIQSKLQDLFGQKISIAEMFKYSTIHALAKHFSQAQEEQLPMAQNHDRVEIRRARQTSMKQQRQLRQKHRSTNKP